MPKKKTKWYKAVLWTSLKHTFVFSCLTALVIFSWFVVYFWGYSSAENEIEKYLICASLHERYDKLKKDRFLSKETRNEIEELFKESCPDQYDKIVAGKKHI